MKVEIILLEENSSPRRAGQAELHHGSLHGSQANAASSPRRESSSLSASNPPGDGSAFGSQRRAHVLETEVSIGDLQGCRFPEVTTLVAFTQGLVLARFDRTP